MSNINFHGNRKNYSIKTFGSVVQMVISGFFGFMFLVTGIMLLIEGDLGPAITGLVITTPLLLLFRNGFQRYRLIKQFRIYAYNLSMDPYHSIARLSEAVSRPYEEVLKNLNKMIMKGYFPYARIDYANQNIIFNAPPENVFQAQAFRPAPNVQPAPQKASQPVTVTCKGCGASNKIYQQSGANPECEYCGTPLR